MKGDNRFRFTKNIFYFICHSKGCNSKSSTISTPLRLFTLNRFLKDSLDLTARIFPVQSITDTDSISSLEDKTSSAIFSALLEMSAIFCCHPCHSQTLCHSK